MEDIFGKIFWEEFFGRNYLVEINKELMFFVKILSQCTRKEGQEFRSLEVRGKLIALKKGIVYALNLNKLIEHSKRMCKIIVPQLFT